jgi:hypothetical protein
MKRSGEWHMPSAREYSRPEPDEHPDHDGAIQVSDREPNKVEPVGKNPFGPKVLPMSPV